MRAQEFITELFNKGSTRTDLQEKDPTWWNGHFVIGGTGPLGLEGATYYEFNASLVDVETDEALAYMSKYYGKELDRQEDAKLIRRLNEEMPSYVIDFVEKGKDDDSVGITGSGNVLEVLATVLNMTAEVVKKKNPVEIIFSAQEASRIKLYDRLVGKFAKELGYDKVITRPTSSWGKKYILVRTA